MIWKKKLMRKFGKAENSQFRHLKKFSSGQSLRNDQETNDAVRDWLKGFVVLFSPKTQKLAPRYARCLNLHGNFVAKQSM
jgi:hypothetical protein